MKLLAMLLVVGLCLVAIFVGSRDAARKMDDYKKYGGDDLIKAISEYNEKSNALRGPIGSVGVTRTPLSSNGKGSSNTKKIFPGQQNMGYDKLPDYMMNRPLNSGTTGSGTTKGSLGNYYPSNPYAPKNTRPDTAAQPAPANRGGGGNDYYPPPPLPQQSPSPSGRYSPQSNRPQEYIVPMTLPEQAWPLDKMELAGGQKIRFAGTRIYTLDKKGRPIALPDGYYKMGGMELRVRDGHKLIRE